MAGQEAKRTRIASTQAFYVLQDYLKIDEYGEMVLVSRQAIDELVNLINNKE